MARVLSLTPNTMCWDWLFSCERDAAGSDLDLIGAATRQHVAAQALNDEHVPDTPVRERVRLRLRRRMELREFPPGHRMAPPHRLQALREARPGGWQ